MIGPPSGRWLQAQAGGSAACIIRFIFLVKERSIHMGTARTHSFYEMLRRRSPGIYFQLDTLLDMQRSAKDLKDDYFDLHQGKRDAR